MRPLQLHPTQFTRRAVSLASAALVAVLASGCLTEAAPGRNPQRPPAPRSQGYNIEQALSDRAQLNTIGFSCFGFLTGSLGSDSWFPPGKVADYWGFQALRDNDPTQMGHNTDFLTTAANNMLYVLTPQQEAELGKLAQAQVSAINEYGYRRFPLMAAFRRLLAGDLPAGATGLNLDAVREYSAGLYLLDGQMSLERAKVMGAILHSLSAQQRAYLDALKGVGMRQWPALPDQLDRRALSHDAHVAVMTYASDLASWYLGSVESDVYFCPERHGTYFGAFYLKGGPAKGNKDYTIDSTLTGNTGEAFIRGLSPEQAQHITGLLELQRPLLNQIVETRRAVAVELRKYIAGEQADEQKVLALAKRYGELDGELVYHYATAFAAVGQSLSDVQANQLAQVRSQVLGSLQLDGAFLYSEPIRVPDCGNTDFLFRGE